MKKHPRGGWETRGAGGKPEGRVGNPRVGSKPEGRVETRGSGRNPRVSAKPEGRVEKPSGSGRENPRFGE